MLPLLEVAMSEDEQPGEEGQDELIAGFAALGGPLTGDELMRLLGSDEYHGALVRLAALLMDGDAAAAEDIVQDSLAALQRVSMRLGDPGRAQVYVCRAVMDRSRSVRRRRAIEDRGTAHAEPGAAGAGQVAAGSLGREPWAWSCAPSRAGSARPSCCLLTWACPRTRPPRR